MTCHARAMECSITQIATLSAMFRTLSICRSHSRLIFCHVWLCSCCNRSCCPAVPALVAEHAASPAKASPQRGRLSNVSKPGKPAATRRAPACLQAQPCYLPRAAGAGCHVGVSRTSRTDASVSLQCLLLLLQGQRLPLVSGREVQTHSPQRVVRQQVRRQQHCSSDHTWAKHTAITDQTTCLHTGLAS